MLGERPIRVAVLGASGYAGGELVRLLAAHPAIAVTYLGANSSVGATLGTVHPHLAPLAVAGESLRDMSAEAVASAADVAMLALPHGASASLAPQLLDAGLHVIDLGGDFRLAAEEYPEWYGWEHPSADWLAKAVYGLPELFGEQLPGAQLVANPGCYPTAVILGLGPLLAAGLVEGRAIQVDGKTGLSGAGRTPAEATAFTATEGSIRPYRAPRHQHTPEMERGLERVSGAEVSVLFVPHLVPTVRGVLTTSYAVSAATTEALTECLRAAYSGRPFVRVLGAGEMADTKRVCGSNVIELQAMADPRTGTAVVVGVLDNLVKGAAGQAIQNLNLVAGLPEDQGLPTVGVYP